MVIAQARLSESAQISNLAPLAPAGESQQRSVVGPYRLTSSPNVIACENTVSALA